MSIHSNMSSESNSSAKDNSRRTFEANLDHWEVTQKHNWNSGIGDLRSHHCHKYEEENLKDGFIRPDPFYHAVKEQTKFCSKLQKLLQCISLGYNLHTFFVNAAEWNNL